MTDLIAALELAGMNRDYDELQRLALSNPNVALPWLDEQRASARNRIDLNRERLRSGELDDDARRELREATGRAEGYLRKSGVLRQAVQLELGRQNRVEKADAHRLRMAIIDHRRACIEADIEPEPHDLELWGLVTANEELSFEDLRAMYRRGA